MKFNCIILTNEIVFSRYVSVVADHIQQRGKLYFSLKDTTLLFNENKKALEITSAFLSKGR